MLTNCQLSSAPEAVSDSDDVTDNDAEGISGDDVEEDAEGDEMMSDE